MTQTLWIYSARNQWFTNGKYKIIIEATHRYPFKRIKYLFYQYYDLCLHSEDFEIGSHNDLARRLAPPWQPKTPEEVARILGDSNTLGN